MATQVPQTAIYYPESDGKPIGETDSHVHTVLDTVTTLRDFFRLHSDVYVGGCLMMYYEEGNPRKSFAPDGFVIRGVSKDHRRTYNLWEEGVPPTVVFEFTSPSTRREDTVTKPALYARLGVKKYFLFDPLADYLQPSFQGFRLVEGSYQRQQADAEGRLQSEALGLLLRQEGTRLRFIDAPTEEPLLWIDEVAEALRIMEAQKQASTEVEPLWKVVDRARFEVEARRRAEAQVAELQAELARLRDAPSS